MKPIAVRKGKITDPHYRMGTATMSDNSLLSNVRRKKVFTSYEYYNRLGKEITDDVIAFAIEEYVDETGKGYDNQCV